MLALKAGCVGQPFALTRCSDSREKKPRRRRTKEERRTMVESFIKKYRTSNDGKFPSLNLTHKEVGGSFYIVREIMRDIIQENKVLGPGDASLKTLNLEDCSQEHVLESPDLEVQLSISSITHMADCEDREKFSITNEHQNEESYELVKSDDQEMFASQANNASVAEVMLDKSSDHLQNSHFTSQYENSVAEGEKENPQKSSGSTHDNIGIHEQNNLVPEGSQEICHKVEQSHPFHQSISITSPTKGLMLDEKDAENKSSSVAETTNISAESNDVPKIAGTDVLQEAAISVNSLNGNVSDQRADHLVSGAKDSFSIASSSINNCDLDLSPLENEELISFQEALGMQDSEVEVPFMQGNKVPIMNRTKSTGVPVSSSVNKNDAVQMSMTSQTLVSPASGTSRTEELPVMQPNDTKNMGTKNKIASSDSLSPNMKEISDLECSTKPEDIASNPNRRSNCSSKSSGKANKELESAEVNPVWATIKAFIDAIVKFWTE